MSAPPAPSPVPDTAPGRFDRDGVARRITGLWSFTGRHRTLHLTWVAFFATFVVWFNFAPFAGTIGRQLGLDAGQLGTLALCNVALTVPARLFIGMALDRFGPRRVFAAILVYAAVPCLVFATASSFPVLVASRLALGVVGAGFVVGIRMVSEWFPPREIGMAEGVYGGWGNFGSAAAAFTLPLAAGLVGGDDGWRWAVAATGVIAAAYGLYYLTAVQDTPDGRTYARPRRQGALEVTSPAAVRGLAALTLPLTAVLALIAWRVWREGVIGTAGLWIVLVGVAALTIAQLRQVVAVNGPARRDEYPADDRYPLRSVAVLCLAYFCSFGSELAVVSMLPLFFAQTWDLGPAVAGATASVFAFMNLAARPAGGLLSDLLGSRRRTLRTLLAGLTVGYGAMALLGPGWPVPVAMVAVAACSFCVQSAEGAVYAIVPLVKKRVSGQIAGMAGAYGNVGAVTFLTVYLFVRPTVFFVVLGAAAVVGTIACRWLVEPDGAFAAHLVDEDAAPAAASVGARHVVRHGPTVGELRPGVALGRVPTP